MRRPIWLDQVISSDPALTRLFGAITTIASMAIVFVAEWLLVNIFGPLGTRQSSSIPITQAALTLHHEVLVLAMLIGGMLAMMTGLAIDESDPQGILIACLIATIPLLITSLITLLLGQFRTLELIMAPFLLGAGTLFRRYGSRGSNVGLMMYVGGFFGYILNSQFGINAFLWFAIEVLLAAILTAIIRIVAHKFEERSRLERSIGSYSSRARLLTRLAMQALREKSNKDSEHLRKCLIQLNEMALIVEAYISKDKLIQATDIVRQSLFDLELSLSNLARFADSITRMEIPSLVTRDIADFISEVPNSKIKIFEHELTSAFARWNTFVDKEDELAKVILGRLVDSILNLNQAALNWQIILNSLRENKPDAISTLEHIPVIRAGMLPGSALVSAHASKDPWDKGNKSLLGISPELRSAIQITIAVLASTGFGYLIDQQRFYWASLSALLCFLGVNNAGEQVRKGVYRFIGTVIGVVLGSLLTKWVGASPTFDLITVLAAMFFGVYLSRINYTFLAIGVTIAISMALLQLYELTGALLLIRVVETAVGALIASTTAIFVLPLGPRRVISAARVRFLSDLISLMSAGNTYLADSNAESELIGWSREFDSAYQALIATVTPLQWSLLGSLNREVTELISRVNAVRNYARSLTADLKKVNHLTPNELDAVISCTEKINKSTNVLLTPQHASVPYHRISSSIQQLKTSLEDDAEMSINPELALIFRDFTLIDGALAKLAKTMNFPVENNDTAKIDGSILT